MSSTAELRGEKTESENLKIGQQKYPVQTKDGKVDLGKKKKDTASGTCRTITIDVSPRRREREWECKST